MNRVHEFLVLSPLIVSVVVVFKRKIILGLENLLIYYSLCNRAHVTAHPAVVAVEVVHHQEGLRKVE